MEITTMGLYRVCIGYIWGYGRENGKYYLGFRVVTADYSES